MAQWLLHRLLPGGWLAFGLLFWLFLAWPYLADARHCTFDQLTDDSVATSDVSEFGQPQSARVECLKAISQNLRKDSILAMYGTATVGAIIAFQLRQRNGSGNTQSDADRQAS